MSALTFHLLLAETARGGAAPTAHCVRIERFELRPTGRAQDGQFRVGTCRKTEELALVESADRGGGLAYATLARERLLPTPDILEDPAKALRAPASSLQPGLRLNFHVPAQGRALDGNSADLLFALATLCTALRLNPRAPLAATGALDADGFVRGVAHVREKLAATARALGDDAVVFYPRENDGPDIQALRDELAAQGRGALRLVALDRLEDAAPVLGLPISADWRESPWRGLEQYRREHRAIFFGRAAEEAELCARLLARERAGVPGALVLANSGAGKSSFLQAAIVPRIELELRDARPVRWCLWRPGSAGGRGEDALVASVLTCWRGAVPAVLSAVAAPPASFAQLRERIDGTALRRVRLLWLIDPFEDILAPELDAAVVTALCQFIRDVQRDFGVWVLGGVQSRYLGRLQEQPALIEAFSDLGGGNGNAGMYLLHKLSPTALREMIEGPARLARLTFQPDGRGGTLADAIQRDMEGETDALPLMSVALARLHAAAVTAKRIELLFADYRAGTDPGSSGLKNAIADRADEVFDSAELNDSARRRLPRLLRALVRRTRAEDGDIAPRAIDLNDWPRHTPGRLLIDVFVAGRLLIQETAGAGAGEQVRVVHKALLTHWPKAVEILRANSELVLTRERLEAGAVEWFKSGRNDGALLTSPKDIEDARQLRRRLASDLTKASAADLRTFLVASLSAASRRAAEELERIRADLDKERRAKARLQGLALAAGLAALMAATGAAVALWQSKIAGQSEAIALKKTEDATRLTLEKDQALYQATAAQRAAENAASVASAAAAAEANAARTAIAAEQREATQRRTAEAEREAANTARSATQDVLNRTLRRLTSREFQEDSTLEPLQQAVLDELAPIYQRHASASSGAAHVAIGYAEMMDRIARLRASNQSIELALKNYDETWQAIVASGLQNTPDPRLDYFVENYASLSLAIGDPDTAAAVLEKRTNKLETPASRLCTTFRIEYLRQGYLRVDLDRAEKVFTQIKRWHPSEPIDIISYMACAADLVSLFRISNEKDLAQQSLDLLDTALQAALSERPRSVSYLTMAVHVTLLAATVEPAKVMSDRDTTSKASREHDAVEKAQKLFAEASRLAPNSRLVHDAEIRLRLGQRRAALSDWTLAQKAQAADAARSDSGASTASAVDRVTTNPFVDSTWLRSFAKLIEREPSSPALARKFSDAVRIGAAGLAAGEVSDPVKVVGCQAILEEVSRMMEEFPRSLVAARGVLAAGACVGVIRGKAAPDSRSIEAKFNLAVNQAHTARLASAPDPSPQRRRLLATAFADLSQRSLTDVRSAELLIRLAAVEAMRDKESIRFTSVAVGAILNAVSLHVKAGNSRAARGLLDACPAYSAKQQIYCRRVLVVIASDAGFSSLLADEEKKKLMQTIEMEFTYLDEAANKSSEMYGAAHTNAATAMFMVVRDGGKVEFMDDLETSRRYGVPEDVVAARLALRDEWKKYILAALEAKFGLQDAVMLAARSYWRLQGPKPTSVGSDWRRSAEGEAYLERINRLEARLRPQVPPKERSHAASDVKGKATAGGAGLAGQVETDSRPSNLAGRTANAGPAPEDMGRLMDERGVILLQGNNVYGERIFTYLELSLRNLIRLRDKMRKQEDFMPADFGTILAAGRGQPSRAMKLELKEKHQMVDVPSPRLDRDVELPSDF